MLPDMVEDIFNIILGIIILCISRINIIINAEDDKKRARIRLALKIVAYTMMCNGLIRLLSKVF